MTELLVVMKNGHRFKVPVKDVTSWYNTIENGINNRATTNIHVENGFWINVTEVAVIHPVAYEVK